VELAERLQAKHHGVVALISRCEKAGLVMRITSRSDMRLVEVQLIRRGKQCLAQLAWLHRAEHLSLQGVLAVPAFSGDSPEQAPR
jgi:DNA-binding MarR family transcriptional regulator